MAGKNKIDEISGTETTGHEWDGIEELNTPMPRWWLWIFYATIIFAVIYSVLMPAIPGLPGLGDHTRGVLKHSDRADVMADIKALNAERSVTMEKLTGITMEDIRADDTLFEYAMEAGRSAFGDNCATCHGTGAQGFKGYPNLNDDIWLWGGTFEDIKETLTVGIRSTHEDTRTSLMQGYGRDELLTGDQINGLTDYVLSLSGNGSGSAEAKALFADQCSSCHGMDGNGDHLQGAPDLTDADWLYGGEAADIYQTIYNGRQGVMPHWSDRLSPEMITALAVYVHALGGGEDTPVSQ